MSMRLFEHGGILRLLRIGIGVAIVVMAIGAVGAQGESESVADPFSPGGLDCPGGLGIIQQETIGIEEGPNGLVEGPASPRAALSVYVGREFGESNSTKSYERVEKTPEEAIFERGYVGGRIAIRAVRLAGAWVVDGYAACRDLPGVGGSTK